MDEGILRQFAEAMLAAAPGIPMDAPGIEASIREFGLGHFIRSAGSHAAGLAEAAELMMRLGNGG